MGPSVDKQNNKQNNKHHHHHASDTISNVKAKITGAEEGRTRPARARRFGVNRVKTPGADPKTVPPLSIETFPLCGHRQRRIHKKKIIIIIMRAVHRCQSHDVSFHEARKGYYESATDVVGDGMVSHVFPLAALHATQ